MDITGRVVSKIGWHWMSRFSSKTLAFQKSQQDIEWIYCSVSGLVILKMVCFSCFSCFSCVIPFQQRGWFQADKNGASEPRNLSKKNEKFRGRWLWPASAPVNFKKSSYQCWQTHKPRSSVPWSMRTQHPCWKIDCHLIILLFKTWPFRFFGCHRFLKAKFGAWKLLLRAWNIYGKPRVGVSTCSGPCQMELWHTLLGHFLNLLTMWITIWLWLTVRHGSHHHAINR